MHLIADVATAGVVAACAAVAGWLVGRPFVRRWGLREDELRRAWPGDEIVPHPTVECMRAVSVDAPPAAVWPWLAQMGQGRGGLYSYDRLENLLGLDIHSVDRVVPELQDLRMGDVVRMVPDGWLGMDTDRIPTNTVVRLDPGRSLVLRPLVPATGKPPTAYDGTWTFVVTPDGEARSRLIVRGRNRAATWPGSAQWLLQEPVHFAMERRMLHGIKRRAERLHAEQTAIERRSPVAAIADGTKRTA